MNRKSASRKSESDRNSGDFSRYKSVISPTMDMSSFKESSRDSNLGGHKTPDLYKYDTISPTFDGRTRNISGDYRETVEKSLATSQNLMSVVTGSLVQKKEQPKSRPQSQNANKQQSKKPPSGNTVKDSEQRKKMEVEKNKVAGAVTDIMIKEVGTNWVSLCWKKPQLSRGSPVITYKVEAWLCGEGAFWVELGRTPIPQFDAFNLKPDKCYHFRVTARNKRGWGESIMTSHKVDLSRPTVMPTISSDLEPVVKALAGSRLRLPVRVGGEPKPQVAWHKDGQNVADMHGVTVSSDGTESFLEIERVDVSTSGKYTISAANLAGKANKSVQVQAVENQRVFEAYSKFRKWQGMVQRPLAPFMVNGPRDRRVQAGQAITLTCRVVSNPWPQVRWYREDEEILPDEYTNMYAEAEYQHLQIDDVTLDHGGNYSVEAFNELGSVRSHFTVVVDSGLDRHMPPFFTKELDHKSVKAGSNLLLHSRVESYPYIGVTWHESGSKLRQNSSTHKLVDDDGNVVLVVCDVDKSNFYACSIINEIAENSTTCQVDVSASDQPMLP